MITKLTQQIIFGKICIENMQNNALPQYVHNSYQLPNNLVDMRKIFINMQEYNKFSKKENKEMAAVINISDFL